MSRTLCRSLLPLLLLAPAARAGDEGLGVWRNRLNSLDPKTAEAALTQLLARGPEGRKAAEEVLEKALRDRAKVLGREAGALGALFEFLDDGQDCAELDGAILDHRKKAKELVDFAFNELRYPYPKTPGGGWRPGFDYQRGQILLEGMTELAAGAYNRIEAELLKRFGQRVRAETASRKGLGPLHEKGELLDDGKAVPMLYYKFTDGTKQWARAGGKLAKAYGPYDEAERALTLARALAARAGMEPPPPPAPPRPLAAAAGALFAGHYERAGALRPPEDSFEGRLFEILVARHVLVLNLTPKSSWNKMDLEGLKVLNLYRLAAGLWPLKTNPKVFAAAWEHSQYQADRGQLLHDRPEADMKSCTDRGRKMGYKGTLMECLAVSAPAGALFEWRCDAGHHRALLWPAGRTVGIATVGGCCTYNVGDHLEIDGLRALMGEK